VGAGRLLRQKARSVPLRTLTRGATATTTARRSIFLGPFAAGAGNQRVKGVDDAGRLVKRSAGPGNSFRAERPTDMTFEGGGAGLWSTVDDYLAFARLFLGDGAVDGVRLLRPETLALMTTNRLTAAQRATAEVAGLPFFAAGHGFGMSIAVVMEPDRAEPALCGGGVGAVGWPGAFGGWWQADPNDRSVRIFLTHNMLEREQFERGIGLGVYGAIREFHALSSNS
jgi:CubicO group peptidase (beta-lactamase class C family)